MRNASNSTRSTNNATPSSISMQEVHLRCGTICLTLQYGLVINYSHNFKTEQVEVAEINKYIKKGWLKYGWARIISACLFDPTAGNGNEEEFMMQG